MSVDNWRRNAERLERIGRALAREGLRLAYHNHAAEFAPLADGSTGWGVLVSSTDPPSVSFELDVGWAAAAGLDPAALLRRHGARVVQLHLKDVAGPVAWGEPVFADVGAGSIDWTELGAAALEVGVREAYIERDGPVADPLASASRSLSFLRRLRLRG